MPGLVPGIHVFLAQIKDVDGMEFGLARIPHY